MNYSKTIREYCLKNPGMVFDMSYERDKHFSMVPYKTFCKILSRIEAEGIIRTYSKGIYIINSNNTDVDPVIAFYAREDCGIIAGNELFYSLGLTKMRSKPIVIYTNAMETTTKNIGDDYRLERLDYPYMNLISDMIILLELIENRDKIKDLDLVKFNDAMFEYARRYKDMDMRDALKCHRYTYSTIFTIDQLLTGLGIKNNFNEIARKCYQDE